MYHGSSVSAPCATDSRISTKEVWIQTRNKDVFTAATEAGFNRLVFTEESRELAQSWKGRCLYMSCTFIASLLYRRVVSFGYGKQIKEDHHEVKLGKMSLTAKEAN